MDPTPLYLQLLGPGLLWIMVHCGGMCGPLVAGLRLGEGGWLRGGGRLALYQLGRALPLAAAGAIAGSVGAAMADWHAEWGPWLILILAGGMLLAALRRLGWMPWPRADGDAGSAAVRILRPVTAWAAAHPRLGVLAIGAALALLPCGVVYWVLSLAAASGSAVHGALLPALLVAISTPPLALAAIAGASATGRLRARLAWLPTAALLLSAAWLGLHGAAALEWIPHAHLGKVMLW